MAQDLRHRMGIQLESCDQQSVGDVQTEMDRLGKTFKLLSHAK